MIAARSEPAIPRAYAVRASRANRVRDWYARIPGRLEDWCASLGVPGFILSIVIAIVTCEPVVLATAFTVATGLHWSLSISVWCVVDLVCFGEESDDPRRHRLSNKIAFTLLLMALMWIPALYPVVNSPRFWG